MKRLLYLGLAFPPGVAGRFPELQPAGHLIETSMIEAVRPWFDVRSVGISELPPERLESELDSSPGLPHALNLLDRQPEVWNRFLSLNRLRKEYLSWRRDGWGPDIIVVCNFSPIYNAFVRWLKRQDFAPPLVLYVADSGGLGQNIPWMKRFRYRFKPMVYPDEQMARCYDACVSVSRTTEKFIAPLRIPWLWLPNGCDPQRALPPGDGACAGPVSFGYFGALGAHTGVPALLKVFGARERSNPLRVCGYGKARPSLEAACRGQSWISFHGPLRPDECLRFAQTCDVLVNPRPICLGNDNNFSSKVFEYALAGRAILSSRLSGVDLILGNEAFYFDENDFERSLEAALTEAASHSRVELRRRGAAIQKRMLTEYSWAKQGERLASFLEQVVRKNG